MVAHHQVLVKSNNLTDRIVVIPGKVEEVSLPEQVDTTHLSKEEVHPETPQPRELPFRRQRGIPKL